MTPDQKMFRDIRVNLLKLTQNQMARALGFHHKIRISEFERETNPTPIPQHILNAMLRMGEDRWHLLNPAGRTARTWNRRTA
jgi:hypothetical protein